MLPCLLVVFNSRKQLKALSYLTNPEIYAILSVVTLLCGDSIIFIKLMLSELSIDPSKSATFISANTGYDLYFRGEHWPIFN